MYNSNGRFPWDYSNSDFFTIHRARKLPNSGQSASAGPMFSVSNKGLDPFSNLKPVRHPQKTRNADVGWEDSGKKRRPRSTLLPTPTNKTAPANKTISRIGQWQRGDDPVSTVSRPSKGRKTIAGINKQASSATVPGSSSQRKMVRKLEMPTQGPWFDRRGRLRNPESSSDSESDSSTRMVVDQDSSAHDSEIESQQQWGRKTTTTRARTSSSSEESLPFKVTKSKKIVIISSDEEEDEAERLHSLPDTHSEESDILYTGENIGTESVPVASASMLQAILPFVPLLPARNLPFLRRNLRASFRKSFYNHKVEGKRSKSTQQLSPKVHEVVLQVLFRTSFDGSRVNVTLHSWVCPLCKLFGELDSRQMLNAHLESYHSGISVSWLKKKDNLWRLILTFPIPVADLRPVVINFPFAAVIGTTVDRDADLSITSLTLEDETVLDIDIKARMSPVIPVPVPVTPTRSSSPLPIEFTPKFRSLAFASPTPPPPARDPLETPPARVQPRYPSPPPADNPLGPAARYPYLPATSEDGKITIEYSCRPGGPYLYDLLGILPLDEFGVLSWAVLDREAEIFESDDISDEHKVMHALWGRWIFLNRKQFVQDYVAGVMEFIDKYWLMIHRAAGWSALRNWILMLMVNKYLNASEVAEVLRHYEKKTDMKSWYNS
ncbi:hypothetical protein GYMLUDRAFT_667004 [Collybiopsis luxurians FD-317 M1]|uniref:Uncharacterized protein n=1 Tax=Collybiopsis luxurians FD-317 M1 TaxID=944289 RepID=A0A0D0CBP6_9AGAR|nr:hypothetical protein GYMLUDRAFT_667004 [Collybiopsis luxurians FD-317 M1]